MGVWGLLAADFSLVRRLDIGWGIFAAYFLLINAAAHIVQAFALRSYNPGLGTSVAIFAPLGATQLAMLQPAATLTQTLCGLGVALGVHAAILARVAFRLRALAKKEFQH